MSQRELVTPSATHSASTVRRVTPKHPRQARSPQSTYLLELATTLICGGTTLLSSFLLPPPTSKPPAAPTVPKPPSPGLLRLAQHPTRSASTTKPTMRHRALMVGSAHNLQTTPTIRCSAI